MKKIIDFIIDRLRLSHLMEEIDINPKAYFIVFMSGFIVGLVYNYLIGAIISRSF